MDSTKFLEESRSYTREEVISLISKYQANVKDYIIQTYFNIFEITSDSLLYTRFRQRFNNIIFNNLKEIMNRLTITVFYKKMESVLEQELSSLNFISCIFPYNPKSTPCPITIQYFNPSHGIDHRILAFAASPLDLSTVLIRYNVISKLVGYCGDFSYSDPGVTNATSDYFTSLRVLKGGTILYLPYSDGFISRLFDLLVDYLPENILLCLTTLGETLMGLSSKTPLIQALVSKYKTWLSNNRTPHLLLSDYAKDVIDHFSFLSNYLVPFQCLPRSIETLLGNVLQRFLLVFMRELYLKVNEIKLMDDCAIMYHQQLVQIRNLFRFYEQTNYIPAQALECFNRETDILIQNHIIDVTNEQDKVKKLYKEIMKITNVCYVRAGQYIDPLLGHFPNFDVFSWVFLENSSINVDKVHQSYHIVFSENCSGCRLLYREVKNLNTFLTKFPLVEMEDKIVTKWVNILEQFGPLPIVTSLLEYVFALPASYDVVKTSVENDQSSICKEIIRFNWRTSHEGVIDNLEEFFGEQYLDQAQQIVADNKIDTFVD